ncbi:MAG TPA: LamG domain-containing protein, partial [Planctomycetaceae bacterium]|nr:LamG domain-containing protein [Planctomycetaceae bacterium]
MTHLISKALMTIGTVVVLGVGPLAARSDEASAPKARPAAQTASAAAKDAATTRPLAIDKPLVGYWDFDDRAGTTCRDRSGHGRHARGADLRTGSVRRIAGVFGNALWFSGRHRIKVHDTNLFRQVTGIAISAWVQPVELSHYREIFRKEDGNNRVLFSFQHDGTILSLGLNIDGQYLECDATIDPQHVRDGRWHHCAATYDGRAMRVYLDGKQVGELKRPGR